MSIITLTKPQLEKLKAEINGGIEMDADICRALLIKGIDAELADRPPNIPREELLWTVNYLRAENQTLNDKLSTIRRAI